MFASKKLVRDSYTSDEARLLVYHFIRCGIHSDDWLRDLPDIYVEHYLQAEKLPIDDLVSKLVENHSWWIPKYESLTSDGTWEITKTPGITGSFSQLVQGVETSKFDLTGHNIFRCTHTAEFSSACRFRDLAIGESSLTHFYSALTSGIASIEAFVNLEVEAYNKKNPEKKFSTKGKSGLVRIDEKLRDWLPIMTGVNIEFDKSRGWDNFVYLKKIRNNVMHPKPGKSFTTLDELADALNRFRSGIGGIMFILYSSFGYRVPSEVIRASQYPAVRVDTVNF